MPRQPSDADKLLEISALCQAAVQDQRDRERRHGYGLDDYTEGRIVGGANLARKVLRVLMDNSAGGPSDNRGSRRSLAG